MKAGDKVVGPLLLTVKLEDEVVGPLHASFSSIKSPPVLLCWVVQPEGFRKDAGSKNQSIIACGPVRDPVDASWYPSIVLLHMCFEGPGLPMKVP